MGTVPSELEEGQLRALMIFVASQQAPSSDMGTHVLLEGHQAPTKSLAQLSQVEWFTGAQGATGAAGRLGH